MIDTGALRRKCFPLLRPVRCSAPAQVVMAALLLAVFGYQGLALADNAGINDVSNLQVREEKDVTLIRLVGSQKPMFSAFKLERPPRLTIDLANCQLTGVSDLISVDSWAVGQVATTQFSTDSSTVARIMINLRRRSHYSVRAEGHDLIIKLVPHDRRPEGAQASAGIKAPAVDTKAQDADAERRVAQAQKDAQQARAEADRYRSQIGTLVREDAAREARLTELQNEVNRLESLRSRDAQRSRTEFKPSDSNATQRLVAARAELEQLRNVSHRAQTERKLLEHELSAALSRLESSQWARRAADAARTQADKKRELAEDRLRTEQAKRLQAEQTAHEQGKQASTLRERVASLQAQHRSAIESAQAANHKAEELAQTKQQLAKNIAQARSTDGQLRKRVKALEADLGRRDRASAEATNSLAELKRRLAAAERQLAEADSAAKSRPAKSQVEQLQHQLKRQIARQDEAVAARESAEQAAQKARQTQYIAEQRVSAMEARLNQLGGDIQRASDEATTAQRTVKDQATRISELNKSLADADRERTVAEERQHAAEVQLKAKEAELARLKAAERRETATAKTAPMAQTEKTSGRSANEAKAAKLSNLEDVRFVDTPTHSEVHLQVSGSPTHQITQRNGAATLQLRLTALPKTLQRTLDTSAFAGPVRSVSSFSPADGKGTVEVRVALSGSPKNRLERSGDQWVWQFEKRLPFGPAVAEGRGETISESPDNQPTAESYDAPRVAAARTAVPIGRSQRRQYSGRRVDLNFKDADIHNVLRLLAEVGDINIVTSDAVKGQVTIRMKNVPWDQALDVILRAKELGQVREGSLVRVAPIGDLEKEREAEIARQKQLMMLQPMETRLIPLSYAQASDILSKLQYTLSPRGKLTFDQRTNMVIARDLPTNLELMEKMIHSLDTQTPQVMIEARIVEARTNYSKQVGIQWGGSVLASSATGNATGLAFPNEIGVGGGAQATQTPTGGLLLGQAAANPNFAVNMPAPVGLGSGGALGFTLGSISGAYNVNLRLSAAESKGNVRIISAPRITTLDNVQATIEQGVTIPYSQVSATGVQTQFRDAKLALQVRPHVTADGSVIMNVAVQRNEPDFANTGPRGEPTILKKQAETEMLVKDGDTAVIGGIYTTKDGRAVSKVPWFGDIPILGWLFKTRTDTSDREEVLVFITPHIINRAVSIGQEQNF